MPRYYSLSRCGLWLLIACLSVTAGCSLLRGSKPKAHALDEFSCGEKTPPGQPL